MTTPRPIQISRDPFARTTTVREGIKTGDTCTWCGGTRKGGSLFRYTTESDGRRRSPHRGLFCCKPCHDAYHGQRN